MFTFLETVSSLLAAIASACARVLLMTIAALLFIQVILRYGFSSSLPWPEEASRYLMIWVVMLAGSLLVKDEQLVRVDFFDALWPKNWLKYRNALFRLLLVVLLAILAWKGMENAMFGLRRQSVTIGISFFWIYLSVPVGAVLMMFQMFALAIKEVLKGPASSGPSILKSEL
nr:TRAP transporter small permease [uncultured Cohaesibacter sp.]